MTKKNNVSKVDNEKHGLSSSTKKSMIVRIISAIVMVVLVVPTVFLGDWIYFGIATVLLAVACYEILGCAGKRTILIYIIYLLFVAAIAYWPLFKGVARIGMVTEGTVDIYFQSICLPITIVVVGFFLLFLLTVIYKDFSVVDASFLLTMGIIIGLGFQGIFYLRYIPFSSFGITNVAWSYTADNTVRTSLLLIFIAFSTIMTDTGAYFVGVFFGKNKMNERISPKKTWEGFVGGVVISAVLTMAVGIIFAACGYPILPILDLAHWYFILPLALVVPFVATLGDFVFSSIKRYWGIKDYGHLIPGHGGVLDRLDSIFFSVMISSIYIYMITGVTSGTVNWESLLI